MSGRPETTQPPFSDPRSMNSFLDGMRETMSSEGRKSLLRALRSYSSSDKQSVGKFLVLGGIEVLSSWVVEAKELYDTETLVLALSCLDKLPVSMETLKTTDIGKTVNALKRFDNEGVQARASALVAKWEKMIRSSHEPRSTIKPPARPREVLPTKKPHYEERPAYRSEPLIREKPHKFRWAHDSELEKVKLFWRTDEPNTECASRRPPPSTLGEHALSSYSNLEEFRRRERLMEREFKQKEREKDDVLQHSLEDMVPNVVYSTVKRERYIGIFIEKSDRVRPDSQEFFSEESREKKALAVNYQRESDTPGTPKDSSSATAPVLSGLPLIPLAADGAFPLQTPGPVHNSLPNSIPLNRPHNLPMTLPQPIPGMSGMPLGFPYFGMMPQMIVPPPIYNPSTMMTARPANFRTEACKRFHSATGCTHGDNCHFIHDFKHEGAPIPNVVEWRKSNLVRLKNLEAMKNAQQAATTPHQRS